MVAAASRPIDTHPPGMQGLCCSAYIKAHAPAILIKGWQRHMSDTRAPFLPPSNFGKGIASAPGLPFVGL